MDASSLWQRLRGSPTAMILVAAVVAADVWGVTHAFRGHGLTDGVTAAVFPPYALYRSVEAFSKHVPADPADIAKTDKGRRMLARHFTLKPEIWEQLLKEIQAQKTHQYRTDMEEIGALFRVTATVEPEGPALLTVQGTNQGDAAITLVDADRDQTPEALRIVKAGGDPALAKDIPVETVAEDDQSQFLLAWALAWGQIAKELKQLSAEEYGIDGSQVIIEGQPVD